MALPMLTLDELCADMAASGRHLTPRAARDWWTRGLLPRPRRHGLGRGKGTETFWTEPRITERAQAAYDLLAAHPSFDTAILALWLWGFPVDLGSVREVYGKLINCHFNSIHARSGQHPEDAVGKLAGMLARQIAKSIGAPTKAQNDVADLAYEFLVIFYGVDEETESEGLAELWKKAAPYLGNGASRPSDFADIHPRDDDLATWARYLKEMASLTAQRKAITSSTDYELIRARRLVHLLFGFLGRLVRQTESAEELGELGHRLLLVFGRLAVPILITVLRGKSLRHKAVSFILDLMLKSRQMTTLGPTTKVR